MKIQVHGFTVKVQKYENGSALPVCSVMECWVECVGENISSSCCTDVVFIGCEVEVEAQDWSTWFLRWSPANLHTFSRDALNTLDGWTRGHFQEKHIKQLQTTDTGT